jgi:hypothetical protein
MGRVRGAFRSRGEGESRDSRYLDVSPLCTRLDLQGVGPDPANKRRKRERRMNLGRVSPSPWPVADPWCRNMG